MRDGDDQVRLFFAVRAFFVFSITLMVSLHAYLQSLYPGLWLLHYPIAVVLLLPLLLLLSFLVALSLSTVLN
jgi:hypothetical protein